MTPPVRSLHWKRAWRIIPTLYPERDIYAGVADSEERSALVHIERLTNLRVLQESGEISHLRPGDVLPRGKSAYNVTAHFSHLSTSRFSDGRFPVFYCTETLQTAVAETVYHRARFLSDTNRPAMSFEMRVLVADVRGAFHDLRGLRKSLAEVYSPESYAASQRLGGDLWRAGSAGIIYESVRREGGRCLGVFRPQNVRQCRQERCLLYVWDGTRIRHVYEIREYFVN
jgi:hypothetical protein